MSARAAAAALLLLVVGGIALFWALERALGAAYSGIGAGPELIAALEQSQVELKQLAELDPERADEYKVRFAATQDLLNHLRIVEHNRDAIARRFDLLLLGIAAATLAVTGTAVAVRHGRDAIRLGRLRAAVEALARGDADLDAGTRGHDAIGSVAAMVEEASRVVIKDRRRLAALQGLVAWQEAARRVLHELRTPLTSARLGLERAQRLAANGEADQMGPLLAEVRTDVDRLAELASQFAGFARLGPPRLVQADLNGVTKEFAAVFSQAWPSLRLEFAPAPTPCPARFDRAMLRQVLTNLCDNAARAIGGRPGTVRLVVSRNDRTVAVDVADDGPGIDPAILPRVFEPYVTTAEVGRGLGLGLAISRKILLDHGGELDLVATGSNGTSFRLSLPLEGSA